MKYDFDTVIDRQNAPYPWRPEKRILCEIKAAPLTAATNFRLLRLGICLWKDGCLDKRAAQWEIMNRLKNGESSGAANPALGPPDFRLLRRWMPDRRHDPWSPTGQPNVPRLRETAGYAEMESMRRFYIRTAAWNTQLNRCYRI